MTLNDDLKQLTADNRRRTLRTIDGALGPRMVVDGHQVLMLSGSNYLDLAQDARVVAAATEAAHEFGCAAGGARLISGNRPLHERLESNLAAFCEMPAALTFSTGYMANIGVLTALAGSDDVIFSDALNHASIIDGARLSGARVEVFRHRDADDFRERVRNSAPYRRAVLITDGVFSMDGDVAPIGELTQVARDYGITTIVDDAHGVGVLGDNGRGVAEGHDVDLVIGNLGKSLGSFGAFVACDETTRDYLINFSRPFIFTCGLAPPGVAAADAALDILRDEPERRVRLLERSHQLRTGLQELGWRTLGDATHIVPALVGSDRDVMEWTDRLLQQGVYVQGIRYPSVPQGTARLRMTPMSSHSTSDIDSVLAAIQREDTTKFTQRTKGAEGDSA